MIKKCIKSLLFQIKLNSKLTYDQTIYNIIQWNFIIFLCNSIIHSGLKCFINYHYFPRKHLILWEQHENYLNSVFYSNLCVKLKMDIEIFKVLSSITFGVCMERGRRAKNIWIQKVLLMGQFRVSLHSLVVYLIIYNNNILF